MKRMWFFTLAALLMGWAVGAWAQDVSLGDYARKQREKQKPASPTTRVFTNDDVTSSAPLVTSDASKDKETSADADKNKTADAAGDKATDKMSPEEMAKAASEFKARIAQQKQKVAETQRNMDVSEREFKLHSIDWYTQAGNALLDPKKYKDETDKHNKEMDDLRKQRADAQAEIEKIRDEIRKAGLSSSIGE